MSQQLLDLINRFGGEQAVEAMAAKVGLPADQVQSAMAALMPAVAGGLTKEIQANGTEAIDAAAAPAADLAPGDVASPTAVATGGSLVSQIFGGNADAVTAHAAQATGLDSGVLAQLLPMVTSLAAGTLASKASGPQGAAGHADGHARRQQGR